MAFAWLGGIATAAPVMVHTSRVVEGQCYSVFWNSKADRMAFGIWYFLYVVTVDRRVVNCVRGESHSVEQSSCRIQRPDNQRCLLPTAFTGQFCSHNSVGAMAFSACEICL